MNRIKQLKAKVDHYAPEITVISATVITTVSLAAAVHYKHKLSEMEFMTPTDISRTEDGKVVLSNAAGYAMAILFENLPISTFTAIPKA